MALRGFSIGSLTLVRVLSCRLQKWIHQDLTNFIRLLAGHLSVCLNVLIC